MAWRIHFRSLRARITVWVMVAALLPLLIAGFVIYGQRVKAIKANAFLKLEAIRDLKAREVNNWLAEEASDIRLITDNSDLRALEGVFGREERLRGDMDTIRMVREHLRQTVKHVRSLGEMFIVNVRTGKVGICSNPLLEGEDRSVDLSFTEPLRTRQVYIKDITFSERLKRPVIAFSAPVFCLAHGDHAIGVLVFLIDLRYSLYDLLLDRTSMGRTGETLIVDKDGVALNELRWYERAPLKLRIEAQPAARAFGGETGIVEADDYRGVKVLAAYTHIPRMGWGFVAKQDLAEIYAPISAMLGHISMLVAVLAVAVYGFAFYLARGLSRPIVELAGVSERVEGGDLSARNRVEQADEIGYLAQSFNRMVDMLGLQMRVREGGAEIIETVAVATDLSGFSTELLRKLYRITGSDFAAFYLHNEADNRFEHVASIGADPELLKPFDADSLEGELGGALAMKEISRTVDIPGDTVFRYRTTAGTAVFREIITIPLLVESEVAAVISLGSLRAYPEASLEILNLVWVGLSTAFANLLANEGTRDLAVELRIQTEELQEQAVELETQRRQVEEADRLKSEFLSNMSHELRTPLNSILALSQLMLSEAGGEDAEYLSVIERNGRTLLNLINEILDLSKIESGRMDVIATDFAPRDVVERALETVRPIAEEKGLDLHVRIDGVQTLRSDREKVEQILINLLSNAVKFTDEGEVEIAVSASEGNVLFAVRDTGIGISDADRARIFEAFRQADGSTTRRHGGTGLGLSIARKLAGLLGGEITVQSRPGEGSVFTLVLPPGYQEGKKTAEALSRLSRETAVPRSEIEKLSAVRNARRILVVEDNEVAALQIRSVLEEIGFTVAVAPGGAEALKSIGRAAPDAVVLDLMMPEVDGFEVLRQIRSAPNTAHISVLVLTAKELTAADRSRLADSDIQELVQKGSVDRELLAAKVKQLLSPKMSPAPPGTAPPARASVSGRTILVVEDNPDSMFTITSILKKMRCEYVTAEGGEQAVRMAAESRPALILMDIQLPGLSGLDAIRQIKADPDLAGIPIVALTAKAMVGDREEMLADGCDDYLAKPFGPADIERIVQRWMG